MCTRQCTLYRLKLFTDEQTHVKYLLFVLNMTDFCFCVRYFDLLELCTHFRCHGRDKLVFYVD